MRRILLNIYDDYVRPMLYRLRTWNPVWIHVINRKAVALFQKNPSTLSPIAQRIVNDVRVNGITTSTLEELFPNENIWSTLEEYIKTHAAVEDEAQFGKKKFLAHYWGVHPELDVTNPFFQLAMHPTVIGIANAYMGMWTKLKYYDLATSLTVPEGTAPQQSQNWHRDPEEPRMIKFFLYMSDVDEGAGPFIYVPESTKGNRYGHLFPQQVPKGSYPSWNDVKKTIPENEMRTMTGKRGTIIFCDTTGIHRGGYALKKDRTMFTAFFSAPSYSEHAYYRITPKNEEGLTGMKLSSEQNFAIEH